MPMKEPPEEPRVSKRTRWRWLAILSGVLVIAALVASSFFSRQNADPRPSFAGSVGIPPWQATPANTPKVPRGFVPAWKDPPPAPDPTLKPPPLMPLPADARPIARGESGGHTAKEK